MGIPNGLNPLGRTSRPTGDGTEGNPFLIYTPLDLYNIQNNYTAFYKIMNDLDLSSGYPGAPYWKGIGGYSPSTLWFTGGLDGGNNTVYNVKMNTGASCVGFINYTRGAILKNINIVCDVNIPNIGQGASIGGLVGEYNATSGEATISNCHVSGSVISNNANAGTGGFIGNLTGYSNSYIVIDKSSFYGTVNGTLNYVGGLVGYMGSLPLSVTNCWVQGQITGQKNCGGLLGYSYLTASGVLNNCYARGTVGYSGTGNNYHGGAVGYTNVGNYSNSYFQGNVNLNVATAGGFSGRTTYTTAQRLWHASNKTDTNLNATPNAGAYLLGDKTLEELFGPDYAAVWARDPAGIINDGYPYLIDNPPHA